MRLNWDNKVEMSTNAHHVLFSEFLAPVLPEDYILDLDPDAGRRDRPSRERDCGDGHAADAVGVLRGPAAELLPALTRGDVGFGKEEVIATCERNGCRYLFKVARSPKMKAEWKRVMCDPAEWTDAGDGWQTHEFRSRLQGWSKERRMVIVRYAFRKFQFVKHEFPPWIGDRYMLNL